MRVLPLMVLAAGLSLASPLAAQPQKRQPPKPADKTPSPSEATQASITRVWDDLIETGDTAKASTAIDEILRTLALVKDTPDADLVAAARVRRLIMLAAAAGAGTAQPKPAQPKFAEPKPAADRAAIKSFAILLRDHPRFAEAIAWGLTPHDKLPQAAALAARLAAAGVPLEQHAVLAAAITLVHDEPDPRARPWSSTPEAILAHFARAKRLVFSPDRLPVSLAAHMVDAVVSTQELDWAAGSASGNRTVGKKYHEIQYDTQAFKYGKPKRISTLDYTLQNIKKVGGVCVEQAYYAEMIGKAIGVPTATITARGDDVGHAWVAYLRSQGRQLEWDLTEGRYSDYKGEAASTRDPQTGRSISDGELRMKGARAGYPHDAAALSLALADAAGLTADREASLNLLERAVAVCPFVPESWDRVADLARQSPFERKDLERWGGAVIKFCGVDYPDFAIKVLAPLVAGLPDQAQSAAAWAWVRERVVESQNNQAYYRYDLAVMLRLREADCRAASGDHDAAWRVCWEAIRKYASETPAVQEVATRCERMLLSQSLPPARLAAFWREAWERTTEPKDMAREFALASNWSVFGLKYAEWLAKAGDTSKSDQIRKRIIPKPKKD
jgi:hypothetical protein